MARYYVVDVPGIGELVKAADSIEDARTWARRGFSETGITVRPLRAVPAPAFGLCERCARHGMRAPGGMRARRVPAYRCEHASHTRVGGAWPGGAE